MQLQSLPTFKRPELRNAEEGHRHAKAVDTHRAVSQAFDDVGPALADLDGTKYDYNPKQGEVVIVDRYLSNGPDTVVNVQAAELRFNQDTGKVDRFKLIKDDQNSVTYEHKRYDERVSSNPTFGVVQDGRQVTFDLNPQNGLIVQFESH